MVEPNRSGLREVVARFDDPEKLEAAVSELQSRGFDRAEISFIAHEGGRRHVAAGHADMEQAADDPATPREAVVSESDLRQGRTLVTSMAAVIAAFAAAGFTVMTGGAAGLAIGAAAAAGVGVGAAGTAMGLKAGANEQNAIDEQIGRGGVVVWVKARDDAAGERAQAILRRFGGADVHLNDLPASA